MSITGICCYNNNIFVSTYEITMSLRFFIVFLACSCTSLNNGSKNSIKDEAVVIQTFDLADQSTHILLRNNWLIRRKRLEIFNNGFNHNSPFVVLFQNSMKRVGSEIDSDHNIFSDYGLRWHDAHMLEVFPPNLADEIESSGLFIRKSAEATLLKDKVYWKINDDGYVVRYDFLFDKQKTSFFNVKMSEKENISDQLDLISSYIRGSYDLHDNACRRIVVGGIFRVDPEGLPYLKFLDNLKLIDVFLYCPQNKDCNNLYKTNPFATMLTKDKKQFYSDRILVNDKTYIYESSAVDFGKEKLNQHLQSEYKLKHLHPSIRKGWSTKIRFPSCR
jgi:hypothetical protein